MNKSFRGESSFWPNVAAGQRRERSEVAPDCPNLFGRDNNDIEYYCASCLPDEAVANVDDIHLHSTDVTELPPAADFPVLTPIDLPTPCDPLEQSPWPA